MQSWKVETLKQSEWIMSNFFTCRYFWNTNDPNPIKVPYSWPHIFTHLQVKEKKAYYLNSNSFTWYSALFRYYTVTMLWHTHSGHSNAAEKVQTISDMQSVCKVMTYRPRFLLWMSLSSGVSHFSEQTWTSKTCLAILCVFSLLKGLFKSRMSLSF